MSKTLKIASLLCLTFLFVQCSTNSENSPASDDQKKEDCCEKESSTQNSETSEITCPECGHKSTEVLPTDVCQIKHVCKNCDAELTPKKGDCCVFCTYGTHKCPSKQGEEQ